MILGSKVGFPLMEVDCNLSADESRGRIPDDGFDRVSRVWIRSIPQIAGTLRALGLSMARSRNGTAGGARETFDLEVGSDGLMVATNVLKLLSS